MTPGFRDREFFHLLFLAHFARRFTGRRWAVKGGICLRFFHRSPRLSEDMDLDVEPGLPVITLRRGVESILLNRAFRGALSGKGMGSIVVTAPKQTATVQRWKVGLARPGDRPLPSKLEFSRRRAGLEYAAGVPGAAILDTHVFAPFAAQYYDATGMASQKIAALASDSRTAVRDLFDLDHLFVNCAADPGRAAGMAGKGAVLAAVRKAESFAWGEFRSDVLPFLDEALMALYVDATGFEALRARVTGALAAGTS